MTGDTRLQDSFGNISVTGLAAAEVVASINSGDITLRFATVPRRVDVTDSFGNITLVLPPGPTAYRVRRGTRSAARSSPFRGVARAGRDHGQRQLRRHHHHQPEGPTPPRGPAAPAPPAPAP